MPELLLSISFYYNVIHEHNDAFIEELNLYVIRTTLINAKCPNQNCQLAPLVVTSQKCHKISVAIWMRLQCGAARS